MTCRIKNVYATINCGNIILLFMIILLNETGGLQIRAILQSSINLKREQSCKMKVIRFMEVLVTSGVTCWALQ